MTLPAGHSPCNNSGLTGPVPGIIPRSCGGGQQRQRATDKHELVDKALGAKKRRCGCGQQRKAALHAQRVGERGRVTHAC